MQKIPAFFFPQPLDMSIQQYRIYHSAASFVHGDNLQSYVTQPRTIEAILPWVLPNKLCCATIVKPAPLSISVSIARLSHQWSQQSSRKGDGDSWGAECQHHPPILETSSSYRLQFFRLSSKLQRRISSIYIITYKSKAAFPQRSETFITMDF